MIQKAVYVTLVCGSLFHFSENYLASYFFLSAFELRNSFKSILLIYVFAWTVHSLETSSDLLG